MHRRIRKAPRAGYLDMLFESLRQNNQDSIRPPGESYPDWLSLPAARAASDSAAMPHLFVQSTSPRDSPDTRVLAEGLDHAHTEVKYIIRGLPRPI